MTARTIVDVRATAHTLPVDPPFRWRDGLPSSGTTRDVTQLEIVADDGTVGVAVLPRGAIGVDLVERRIRPTLTGRDALLTEDCWAALHEADRVEHFPPYALGPVDVALWDLKAKAAGLPLYALLGGARTRIPAYASTVTYEDVDTYLAVADECLAAGFTAIKLHAWGDVARDTELARRLRRHVGDNVDLMYDGSGAFDLRDAIRLGHVLTDLGFGWYEEPMREWALGPYVRLRQAVGVPILGPETTPGVHHAVADWIAAGAVDLVRTGVHYKDGITGALRIAHLADAHGLRAEVHGGGAANLHLACAIPNTTYYEVIVAGRPARPRFPVTADGYAEAPQGPGTGESAL